ncbi:hypothetical protein [Streptomyces sp. NPDC005538]|uniref:hypothetical protein n=1 Tax=unclassified Streptomyces TaxID=2593676 RepID=UPI0033A06302
MRSDDWQLTEDLADFLARGGDFLRSRPALHTVQLTVMEGLRRRRAAEHGAQPPVRPPGTRGQGPGRLLPPSVLRSRLPPSPEQADTLAAHLAGLGHSLPYVTADRSTAAAFAEA